MRSEISFSVVVPCYKAAATIDETVDSVLAQTYGDFELILVDDGSPDDTLAALRRQEAKDPRIRVISKTNGGVSSARNRGIAAARGVFIAFLDADDMWMPEKLVAHAALLGMNPEIGVSYARVRFLAPDGTPMQTVSHHGARRIDLLTLLAENVTCTCSNLVARRSLFDEIGGFDPELDFDEDKEWLLRAHAAGAKFSPIDRVLTGYRTSPAGLASDPDTMRREWERFAARVAKTAPDKVAEAIVPARAIFLRNLARRMLRLGIGGSAPFGVLLSAVSTSPRAVLREPRRWVLTGAAALLSAAVPRRFSGSLGRLLDRMPLRKRPSLAGAES